MGIKVWLCLNEETSCYKLKQIEIQMCPYEYITISLKHGNYYINDIESKKACIGRFNLHHTIGFHIHVSYRIA
jgi:hypothetical protein